MTEKTPQEKATALCHAIIDNFAPDLCSALNELAYQIGRPVILTFTATPGEEDVDINFTLDKKIVIEGEKVE
jgi:hypothetical protein